MVQHGFGRFVRITIATLILSLPSAALAQTPDKEQAKVLVVEGRRLRDGKDYRGALERFQTAYKIVKTPIIGLDLARAHTALMELVEAQAVCDEVGRLPTKDTESAESKLARASAVTLRTELIARLPKLSITLNTDRAATSKPVVLLDDLELSRESLLAPHTVNPGKHTLVVRVAGAQSAATTVTAVEGVTTDVALKVPATKDSDVPATEQKPASGSALRTTGLIVAGSGLVALGVGAALAFSAKSNARDANCDANDVCATPADVEQRRDAVQQAGAATVAVGIGAALAVGGAVLWLLAPRASSSALDPANHRVGRARVGAGVGFSGLRMVGWF